MDGRFLQEELVSGIPPLLAYKPLCLILEGKQFCSGHLEKHDGFRESRNVIRKTSDVSKSMADLLNGIKIDAKHILRNSRRLHQLQNIRRFVWSQLGIASNAIQKLETKKQE